MILQEIGQALDTPDDIIFDWLQEAAFPDQPFGRTILGPAERVSGFGRADLAGFVAEHYGPDRIILAAAGAVDPDRAPRRRPSGCSAHLAPRPRLAGAAGALRRRRAARGARPRAGAHGARLRGAGRARRRRLCRADLRDRDGRRHVLAALPGAARAARALLHHLRPGRRLRRHRRSSPSTPAPAPTRSASSPS